MDMLPTPQLWKQVVIATHLSLHKCINVCSELVINLTDAFIPKQLTVYLGFTFGVENAFLIKKQNKKCDNHFWDITTKLI